jgi:hypothetical protein
MAKDFVPRQTFGRRIVKRESGRDPAAGVSRSVDAAVPDLRRRIGSSAEPMRLRSAVGVGVLAGGLGVAWVDLIDFFAALARDIGGLF